MRHGAYQGRRPNNNSNGGGNNNNRHRQNRPNGGSSNNSSQRPHRNQVLDSNGPDTRVRGTAFQINEKYQSLAKDAYASGDMTLAESYLQHAEHYQRMINEFEQLEPRPQRTERSEEADDQPSESDEDGNNNASETQEDNTNSSEPQEERAPKKQPRARRPKPAVSNEEEGGEDLGLPSSLLG